VPFQELRTRNATAGSEGHTPYFCGNRVETANISMEVMKPMADYDLGINEVWLSVDNTNTNFRGFLRRGK
jgi:hypothetical protein